jgi:hypothetical protein
MDTSQGATDMPVTFLDIPASVDQYKSKTGAILSHPGRGIGVERPDKPIRC